MPRGLVVSIVACIAVWASSGVVRANPLCISEDGSVSHPLTLARDDWRQCLCGAGEVPEALDDETVRCAASAPRPATRAVGAATSACVAGDADACEGIARQIRSRDEGVTTRTVTDLRGACRPSSPRACLALGYALVTGWRVTRDRAEALRVWETACHAGVTRGCVLAGVLLELPELDAHNPARAARYFDRACAAGDAGGCQQLGLLRMYGRGVRRDPAEALGVISRACDAGEMRACYLRSAMSATGRPFGAPEASDARRACDAGIAAGCGQLGEFMRLGVGGSRDPARAQELATRACAMGWGASCSFLANESPEATAAAGLLQRACALGHTAGCSDYATRLFQGRGGGRAVRRAAEIFERACADGDAFACLYRGWMARPENWVAGEEHPSLDRSFDERACTLGRTDACLDIAESAGRTTPWPDAREEHYARIACERGDRAGCARLRAIPRRRAASRASVRESEWARECAAGDGFSCSVEAMEILQNPLAAVEDLVHGNALLARSVAIGFPRLAEDIPSIARLYTVLEGVGDWSAAVDLWQRACEFGDARSCNELLAAYEVGRGVPRDPARALAMARTACAVSSIQLDPLAALAAERLGDAPLARRTLTARCGPVEGSRPPGWPCLHLARMESEGIGGPVDPAASRAHVRAVCAQLLDAPRCASLAP